MSACAAAKQMVSIGIMGDSSGDSRPQMTVVPALQHAAAKLGISVRAEWVPTAALAASAGDQLRSFDGLFAAPGTIKSLSGTLRGIEYARRNNKVFLGTCGGFQHVVL